MPLYLPDDDILQNHANRRGRVYPRPAKAVDTRFYAEEIDAIVGRLITAEYTVRGKNFHVAGLEVIDENGNFVGGSIPASSIPDPLTIGTVNVTTALQAAGVSAVTPGTTRPALSGEVLDVQAHNDVTQLRTLVSRRADGTITFAVTPGGVMTTLQPAELSVALDVGMAIVDKATGGTVLYLDPDGFITAGGGLEAKAVQVNPASASAAQIVLDNGGVDPSAPAAGDIWRNGDALNFRTSSGTVNLAAGGGVTSVFGRSGAVVAASNDYTFSQIDKTVSSLADLTTRSASDLSSGTLADGRLSSNIPRLDAAANLFTGNIQTQGHFELNNATYQEIRLVHAGASVVLNVVNESGSFRPIKTGAMKQAGVGVSSDLSWDPKFSGTPGSVISGNNVVCVPLSAGQWSWGDDGTTIDVGLARNAAGVCRVSDGSTGFGKVITKEYALDSTATASLSFNAAIASHGALNAIGNLTTDPTPTLPANSLPAAATGGNVGAWILVDINGTTYYVPAWQ